MQHFDQYRFIELKSQDPIIRFWAHKAVTVLKNQDLSTRGQIRIIQDIQTKIQNHLDSRPPKNKKVSPKPVGLGCPAQIERLRSSFKQKEATQLTAPKKKIRLPPRME